MADQEDAALLSQTQAKAQQVNALVGKGQTKEALKLALAEPPTNSKSEEVKKVNTMAVVNALKSASKASVKGLVAGFSSDEADVAMKHVFKGMETESGCDTLLEWHNQLHAKFGVACIVRAISERSPCPAARLERQ